MNVKKGKEISTWYIVAIVLIGFMGYATSQWVFDRYLKEDAPAQNQQEPSRDTEPSVEDTRRNSLVACLDDVDKRFYEAAQRAGTQPREYWGSYLALKQQEIDSCQLKYGR